MLKNLIFETRKKVGMLENPEFFKACGHGDWRKFVPENIIKVWKELSFEAKVIAYHMAAQRLYHEEDQ